MGNRAHSIGRNGWKATFDPELWRRILADGMACAVFMGILACTITLVRETDGHDWYAAAKLTAAELLIAVGFDENTLTEYRAADDAVETVSRYELTFMLPARWAREDILAAIWDGASLGALCGFGGALLCLVRSRRPRNVLRNRQPACGRAPQHPHEGRVRVALEPPGPEPQAAATERRSRPPKSVITELAQTPTRSESEFCSPEPGNPEPSDRRYPARDFGKDRTALPIHREGGPAARKRPKRARSDDDGEWF